MQNCCLKNKKEGAEKENSFLIFYFGNKLMVYFEVCQTLKLTQLECMVSLLVLSTT